MKTNKRQIIFNKFGGKCAYTGHLLGDDWQIDHIRPKQWFINEGKTSKFYNVIDNLLPACKIINHYKRDRDLETFREFINGLQSRINKIPIWVRNLDEKVFEQSEDNLQCWEKNALQNRKSKFKHLRYLQEVAKLFGITKDNAFSGKFYFENFISEAKK
jgi:hypothetical protein